MTGCPASGRKLVTSPNFTLSLSADGSAYVTREVEPFGQFWLDRRERLLFSLFAGRGGAAVESAIAGAIRLFDPAHPARERRLLERAVTEMESAGVLIAPAGELSRYGREMARDYLRHRPFPQALADRIAALLPEGKGGRVLDLAAGPGSLALELARRGGAVTMMELSRGFVGAARAEARSRGLSLEAINESCNRLVQHDGQYDLITVSQAIHWLDDVAVLRGVLRCLAEGGSFVVVHGVMTLPERHPLSPVLGDRTPLGNKAPGAFADQVRPLLRRLSHLAEALDGGRVDRHEPWPAPTGRSPLRFAGAELFRQERPIGLGFARAFLSDEHVAPFGLGREAFWADIEARCHGASADDLLAVQEWAVLEFRRGAPALAPDEWAPPPTRVIAFP